MSDTYDSEIPYTPGYSLQRYYEWERGEFVPRTFELPEISSMRLALDEEFMGGRHVILKFKNGYGMSIVTHWGAYGGLEIAWINEFDELWDPFETGDTVMGWLTQQQLIIEITRAHHLPRRTDDKSGGTADRASARDPAVPADQQRPAAAAGPGDEW